MAVTFVQLVNELLRRLNDTVLSTDGNGFEGVRGVQALAKDAINNSIRELIQHNHEWPFSRTKETDTLVVGTGVYSFATDTSIVDWDSFYLNKFTSGTREVSANKLNVITYTDYLRVYRDTEEDGTSTRSNPSVIYQTHDESYGVTPIPDQTYSIDYLYYSSPDDLSAFDSTTIVPDKFRYVIVDGAMMYMMRFRGNDGSAQIHEAKFKKGMYDMRRLLGDEKRYITSTVINRPMYRTPTLRVT